MIDNLIVGYTNDGYVFLAGDIVDPNCPARQFAKTWTPNEARIEAQKWRDKGNTKLATQLFEAADKCESKDRIIVPGAYQ